MSAPGRHEPDPTHTAASDPRAVSAAIAGERARLAAGAAEAPLLEDEIAGLRARLATLERSVSWRVTTPLRTARRLVNGRRALLLRLGRHVRARLGS